MPVDLETDEARLGLELSKYFAKRAIPKLRALIFQRKEMLLPSGVTTLSFVAAENQINERALSNIVYSINELITEKHVALIKLLNMEEIFWTKLKEAIKERNAREIRRLVIGIDSILNNELKLVPDTAHAQAELVQMTPKQMEKMVGL